MTREFIGPFTCSPSHLGGPPPPLPASSFPSSKLAPLEGTHRRTPQELRGGGEDRAGWGAGVQDPAPPRSWGFDPPWSSLLPTARTLSAKDVAELVTAIPGCCPRCSRLLGAGQGQEQRAGECRPLGPACQDSPPGLLSRSEGHCCPAPALEM